MRPYRQEPYLWLHVVGLAALPLWALGIWLGVAAGQPWLPYGVEETLLVLLGVAPWLWMQWQRPFNPFAVLVVSLLPTVLTTEQRQWLRLLKSTKTRIVAVLALLPMIWLLGQCYQLAPLASSVTPIPNHGLGLLVAAIAFSGANLFMQVALSMVALLLLTSEAQFAAASPYEPERIGVDFFRFGLQWRQILPTIERPPIPEPEIVPEPEPESMPEPAIAEPGAAEPITDEFAEPVSAAEDVPPEAPQAAENTIAQQDVVDSEPETIEPESEISEPLPEAVESVQPDHESSPEVTALNPEADVEVVDEPEFPELKVEGSIEPPPPAIEVVAVESDADDSDSDIKSTQ